MVITWGVHTGIKQKSAVQWAGVGMEDGSEVMVIEEPVLYFVVWSLVFGCWAGCVWSVVVGTVMRNWERERGCYGGEWWRGITTLYHGILLLQAENSHHVYNGIIDSLSLSLSTVSLLSFPILYSLH